MVKHTFFPAFYKAVYKKIKEAVLSFKTEDKAYGYFDLFFSLSIYEVSLSARFNVSICYDDIFRFGHMITFMYPEIENLIEIENVKVCLKDGTPVEGFSIDAFWAQFNVDKSPCGFVQGEKVFFRRNGSQNMRKGTFVAYNLEMDSNVVEEDVTGKVYYLILNDSIIEKVREPPN